MRIKFIDYKGRPHYISMPDDTSEIVIKVVKEDMIEIDPTCTVEDYLNKKYPAYEFTVSSSNIYWTVSIMKK